MRPRPLGIRTIDNAAHDIRRVYVNFVLFLFSSCSIHLKFLCMLPYFKGSQRNGFSILNFAVKLLSKGE